MKNHHPSLVSNSNLFTWFFFITYNVYFLQISLWFWKQCTRLGLGPLRRAVTVQKALQGSETKELHEETKESNDFLDGGSLTSSQIIEYSKWSQQEKKWVSGQPCHYRGTTLFSCACALFTCWQKSEKSQKVLCKSAHETETRVARPPEQINVHISIFWIPQIGMEESQYFFSLVFKVKTGLYYNFARN